MPVAINQSWRYLGPPPASIQVLGPAGAEVTIIMAASAPDPAAVGGLLRVGPTLDVSQFDGGNIWVRSTGDSAVINVQGCAALSDPINYPDMVVWQQLQDYIRALPTDPPNTPGLPWNNGGTLCVS